jgi:REP-associated tyrosine transposase
MPDYRRHRIPGATYFFTVNLFDRRSDLLVAHIDVLPPFHIDGRYCP